MRTIYKYKLKFAGEQKLSVPMYSRPLSVQEQHGIFVLWCLVDDKWPLKEITVYQFGTGHEIPEKMLGEYLSTVQDSDGFVWHYFIDSKDRS